VPQRDYRKQRNPEQHACRRSEDEIADACGPEDREKQRDENGTNGWNNSQ